MIFFSAILIGLAIATDRVRKAKGGRWRAGPFSAESPYELIGVARNDFLWVIGYRA